MKKLGSPGIRPELKQPLASLGPAERDQVDQSELARSVYLMELLPILTVRRSARSTTEPALSVDRALRRTVDSNRLNGVDIISIIFNLVIPRSLLRGR